MKHIAVIILLLILTFAGCHLVDAATQGVGEVLTGSVDAPGLTEPVENKISWWIGGAIALGAMAFFGGKKLSKK